MTRTIGLSLGADGVFVLRRDGTGARMQHFNADGRTAELCINGTRCAAQLAFELGWAADRLVIETGAGPVPARRTDSGDVALTLAAPATPPEESSLSHDDTSYDGWFLLVGVPHFVLPWPARLDEAPVADLGPPLRHHPAHGEAGANIDFVRFPAAGRLEIRTFERGVEAETLACGTGVLAATAVGLATGRLETPVRALTAGGFELTVDSIDAAHLSLAGDARLVAKGRRESR